MTGCRQEVEGSLTMVERLSQPLGMRIERRPTDTSFVAYQLGIELGRGTNHRHQDVLEEYKRSFSPSGSPHGANSPAVVGFSASLKYIPGKLRNRSILPIRPSPEDGIDSSTMDRKLRLEREKELYNSFPVNNNPSWGMPRHEGWYLVHSVLHGDLSSNRLDVFKFGAFGSNKALSEERI